MNATDDKAGEQYWDENWTGVDMPQPFSVHNKSLDNYVNLQLDRMFKEIFAGKKDFSILEIGCANSIWPIYFHQTFGAQADGIDYSEVGCEKSRAFLKHYDIPGNVYCADLFSPPEQLCYQYDYVVSFGVVEHFENTQHCLDSCAKFLKPGGTLITLIPNMPSLNGWLQKWADKAVYDVHVPLTKKSLASRHHDTSLNLVSCEYFMTMNLSVVNSGTFSQHPMNKYFRKILSVPSKLCWQLERMGVPLPRNRFTSPYIVATAEKQAEA